MALTPSHGAIGAFPSIALTIGIFGINPIIIILASLWGAYAAHKSMLPDLYGILGGTPKSYTIYGSAHHGTIAAANKKNWYYKFHLLYDKLFHRQVSPYGWSPFGTIWEILQDIILIVFYVTFVGWIATACIFVGLVLYMGFIKLFRDTIKKAWLGSYL